MKIDRKAFRELHHFPDVFYGLLMQLFQLLASTYINTSWRWAAFTHRDGKGTRRMSEN